MSTKQIQELRECRDGIAALARKFNNEAKSILGRATAAGRDVTPSEQSQVNDLVRKQDENLAELAKVKAELVHAERALEAHADDDGAMVALRPRVVPPAPIHNGPFVMTPSRSAPAGNGGPQFSNMFPAARSAGRAEFAGLGDFARAVYERNPRLFNAATGMGEGVGQDGGFFVPMEMYAGLMDGSLQQEAIRPAATIVPMQSAQMTIPMFDLSNRSTGIATMEGKSTPEGTTGTTQKAKVREVNLVARKISVLVPTTTELLQDAPQLFGQLLRSAMTEALAQTLDSWFISGTGAGNPLGIMNSPCLVSVAKDGSQVAATLTPTNIAGMVSRLAPGSWSKAQWIVSPSALAALFTLATVTKNVAGTENVSGHAPEFFSVLPDGKFALCGRPLIVSDRCQALGTKGDIMLVDLSQYIVGVRQNAELAVDTSIGFKESEVWFRLNARIDGQPAQAAAITPRVGSATLSPFVTLDTRG